MCNNALVDNKININIYNHTALEVRMNLYLVEMSSSKTKELFFKVGITKHEDIKARFDYGDVEIRDSSLEFSEQIEMILEGKRYIPNCPYDANVLHSVCYTYETDARNIEKELLDTLKSYKYKPIYKFSGDTECFNDNEDPEELISLIKKAMNCHCEIIDDKGPERYEFTILGMDIDESDELKKEAIILKKFRAGRVCK